MRGHGGARLERAILAIALVAILWRPASRRQSLPCPVWLRWLVELDNLITKTNRTAFIVETLGLSPGMTVLDAGCGPWRLTVPLARGVGCDGHMLALDIQPGMLTRARSKAEATAWPPSCISKKPAPPHPSAEQ